MLDRMLPEEFMEWRAAYLNEPWGDDWEQAATVAAIAHNLGVAFAGGEPQTPDFFIPKRFETTAERELRQARERLREDRDRSGAQ